MTKTVLTLFICIIAASAFAQTSPIYGTSRSGDKYGEGGAFVLENEVVTNKPFYRETAYPLADIIEHRGEIIGISGLDLVGNSFGSVRASVFRGEGPDSKLFNVHFDINLRGSFNPYQGIYKHRGFTVEDNYLVCGSDLDIKIINMDKDSVEYSIQTSSSLSYNSPLIFKHKVYYGLTLGTDFQITEFDIATKSSRQVFTCPKSEVMELNGFTIGNNDYLYVLGRNLNGQTLIKVNIQTGESSKIADLNFPGSLGGCHGRYASLNGWLYNTCSHGGTNGFGFVFRLNPETGAYQKLYDFSSAHANPVGGLVAYMGKLFGLTSTKETDQVGAIFTIDTLNNIPSYIREVANPGGNGHNLDGLFIHAGKLYCYGATSGIQQAGKIEQIDKDGNTINSFEHYQHRPVHLGLEAPVVAEGKFLGICDTVMYNYDFVNDEFEKEFDKSLNIKGFFHSLSHKAGWIYGLSSLATDDGQYLFKYNIGTKQLVKLKDFIGYSDTECKIHFQGDYLYFIADLFNKPRLVRFNLITQDTTSIDLNLGSCSYPRFLMTTVNDTIYFTGFEDCSGQIDYLYKYSISSQNIQKQAFPASFSGNIQNGDITQFNGKIYGTLDANQPNTLFEYNPINQSFKEYYANNDSIVFISNLLVQENELVALAKIKGSTKLFSFNPANSNHTSLSIPFLGEAFRYRIASEKFASDAITSVLMANQLSVSPNPCIDYIQITNSNGGNYRILNSAGTVSKKGKIANNLVPVSDLANGVYILVVETSKNVATAKFIKQ